MIGRFVLSVCCLGILASSLSAAAPEDPKKYAITELDQVDADFAYQGEYAGTVSGENTGLQVIARGDGKFDAVSYPGGLPGAGWDRQGKWKMSGARTDREATFETKIYLGQEERSVVYTVDGKSASVRDSEGSSLGSLIKVHRQSPTLGVAPPWGATPLFSGKNTWHFKGAKVTENGLLQEGTELKTPYKYFMLHVEFMLPYMPYATGQGRSNSGLYLQSRYEVQILDSFGLDGEFNECGALYRYKTPDVNMCFPPLSWQTYDIKFKAAKFDYEGNKTKNATITVWHNGIKIHDNFEIERKTGAGQQEGPESIITKIQNHSNPVRFQNIWIIDYMEPMAYPLAHPNVVQWSPELYTSNTFDGFPHPGPVNVPHITINGRTR
ncbi:MAG TPA: DUF1080 domain-containing protein [Planctomycetaceae bacterium]|nr:DUF1080 domain-containing protein [Planctomycetaceae bacterium]